MSCPLFLPASPLPGFCPPIRFHHIHFSTPDPKAMQMFYAKVLGAMPGKRAQWEAGDLPNANLTYAQSSGPVDPTKGRAIAAIQFEVPDIGAVTELLRSLGLNPTVMGSCAGAVCSSVAGFTDPWGTSVTLVQIWK